MPRFPPPAEKPESESILYCYPLLEETGFFWDVPRAVQ